MTLKAGTETGSLMNHLYSGPVKNEPTPEVGMGATILLWTDRHAATVIGWDGKTVLLQEDDVKRTDNNGMSESQTYECTPHSKSPVLRFRKDKTGSWREIFLNRETNRWNMPKGGHGLMLGVRRPYHDFSF